MTPRRAAVLAMQLPAGSQTWLSCGYDNAWTLTEHLTAAVVDALNAGNWQRAGDAKAKKPAQVKRPADLRDAEVAAARNDTRAQAFLERKQRRQLESQEA